MNANKFVACSSNMEIRLFFVDKESIRYPNIPNKFRANRKGFDACPFLIGEPWICPELPEVEVQCEILQSYKHIKATEKMIFYLLLFTIDATRCCASLVWLPNLPLMQMHVIMNAK